MTATKALTVLCAAAALVPASAAGAPPTIVREDIDETFVDEGLSEACGVEATVHLTGHSTLRMREGGGVLEVFTVNLTGIITSEFRELQSQGRRLGRDPDHPRRAGDRLDPRAGAFLLQGRPEVRRHYGGAAQRAELRRRRAPDRARLRRAESRGLGVVPRHVVHPGLLGGWGCRSHQSQGGHRMKLHANARTCPKSRRLLVRRVDGEGSSLAAAAEAAGVSKTTAAKWVARWRRRARRVCSIAARRRVCGRRGWRAIGLRRSRR